jgi:7-keto-8-aminopelargonate synthetase-like enzyme
MVEALIKTREKNPDNAILVVTEGLFSMDSDTPDLV